MYPIVHDSMLRYREYIGANSTFLDTRHLHSMVPLTPLLLHHYRAAPLPPLPPRPFPPPVVVSKVENLHSIASPLLRKHAGATSTIKTTTSRQGSETGGIPTEGEERVMCQAFVLQMASRNEERTADAVALDLEDWLKWIGQCMC